MEGSHRELKSSLNIATHLFACTRKMLFSLNVSLSVTESCDQRRAVPGEPAGGGDRADQTGRVPAVDGEDPPRKHCGGGECGALP